MKDDKPRTSRFNRYAGFESGLRTRRGRKKPAYRAFRLPLAVENYGASEVLWGLVRPQREQTTVTIQVDRPGGKTRWRRLARLQTTSKGVYSLRVGYRKGQRYRVRWKSPSGETYVGAATRSY